MGEGIVHMCSFVHMCTNSLHNCSKESKILICTVEQTYTYAYCRMKVISFACVRIVGCVIVQDEEDRDC